MGRRVLRRRTTSHRRRSPSRYLRRCDPLGAGTRPVRGSRMSESTAVAIGSDPRSAVSVARQPILDRKGQIFAHELLYRHAPDATVCTDQGDPAGARTLSDAVLSVGLDALTCGLPAFVNLTHQLLLGGAGTLLPHDIVVLEIRE